MTPVKAAIVIVVPMFAAAGARAQAFAPPSAPAVSVQSCVGSDAVELRAGADSALLDDNDRDHVLASMLQRYPAFGRDGAATSAIVLWRQADGSWLYLALKNHPEKPGKVCRAASFAAGVFEFTGALQQKYFFAGRT